MNALKSMHNGFLAAGAVLLLAGTTPAFADRGSLRVTAVGPRTITVDWSAPSGAYRLVPGSSLYKVCIAPEDGERPTCTESSPMLTAGPYTFSGLEPNMRYRIRVEAYTQKRTAFGEWVNPKFRRTGVVIQETPVEVGGRALWISDAASDRLVVRLRNPDFAEHHLIRFVYKVAGCAEEFNGTARSPNGPSEAWGSSDGERGWVDVLSSGEEIQVELRGLRSCEEYAVAAYGFRVGAKEGERLEIAHGRTAGNCVLSSIDRVVATDHEAILFHYADRVQTVHDKRVFEEVSDDFPVLDLDRERTMEDEDRDLAKTLNALKHLIIRRPDEYAQWQLEEAGEDGAGTLAQFLASTYPELAAQLEVEVDPEPAVFQRGDANGDGQIDVSDPVRILGRLFTGGEPFPCEDAADANDDETLDIADPVMLLQGLFQGGNPPPPPFGACGEDPEGNALGCEEYTGCPPTS